MAIDFRELGKRLAVAIKESPGNDVKDPEARMFIQSENAKRVWDIWSQVQMFDPRDQMLQFSIQSGLPDGVIIRYMEACRDYQAARVAERLKPKTPPPAATEEKTRSKKLAI